MKSPGSVICAVLLLISVISGSTAMAAAESQTGLSLGQTVYVPVYSHIFSGDKALPFNLATMLSLRNTDLGHGLRILAVDYFDNDGKLLKHYRPKPTTLPPLASDHVYIRENDETGGFGAKFIVRWEADQAVQPPIIECVMIGARSGQGISLQSRGQVIEEKAR